MDVSVPCPFCDEPATASCHACGRMMCSDHYVYDPPEACKRCQDEWSLGSKRRSITHLAIAAAVFGGLFGLTRLLIRQGVTSEAILTPLVIAAFALPVPVYGWLNRRARRRFLPTSHVPQATLRSR